MLGEAPLGMAAPMGANMVDPPTPTPTPDPFNPPDSRDPFDLLNPPDPFDLFNPPAHDQRLNAFQKNHILFGCTVS